MTTKINQNADLGILAEIATDIAHDYWDECAIWGTDPARLAECEASHDRWTDIAGDLYEGRLPDLTEDEEEALAGRLEDYED